MDGSAQMTAPTDALIERLRAPLNTLLALLADSPLGVSRVSVNAADLEALLARIEAAQKIAQQSHDALNAMMDTWLDYHDAHSLTAPVSGRSDKAFEDALAARDSLAQWQAGQEGEG